MPSRIATTPPLTTPMLTDLIDDAAQLAEELAAETLDGWAADKLRDEIAQRLYDANTYARVAMFAAPEIRMGIVEAANAASDLVDADPRYAPLLSRIRLLVEQAAEAAASR